MGAWIETLLSIISSSFNAVAPYMGAWIETLHKKRHLCEYLSLPIWERGLKQLFHQCDGEQILVAPYMGAWIETTFSAKTISPSPVAPYMGAWIETIASGLAGSPSNMSLPIWERGLKRTGNDKLLVYIVLRGKMQIFYVEFGGGRLLWNMLLISMKNVHRL